MISGMFSAPAHIARLARTAIVLARFDMLLPHELTREMDPRSRRGAKLAGRFARAMAGRKMRDEDLEVRAAAAFEAAGPAYIKFGQILATRGDIVGPRLAAAFSVLQDKLAPFPLEEARAIVEREFGKPVDELFASFSEPVAAASVAQVHRAEIVEDGKTRVVAVKVLRPGIEELFARDIAAFAFAAKWIYRLVPRARRMEPVKFIEVVAKTVAEEMDLRTEAAAASLLRENNQTRDEFHVPEVDWERTTRGVLTTSWIEGTPLTDVPALKDKGFDLEDLGTKVVRSFMTQALMDGFFHADLHPGNLFVVNLGKEGEPLRVGLAAVDFGIMGRLDEATRNYLADILHGFLVGDYGGIARAHMDAGYVPRTASVDDFALALRAIGEPLLGRTADQIPMARLLQQLLITTQRFDMRMQPQLVLLQKTMVVVEGVARDLSPGYDMWETARPVVETFMIERRGPEALMREVADGAQSLLTTLRHAPRHLEEAARQLETLGEITDGGLKLHPDTLDAMAHANHTAARKTRLLWLAAAVLIAAFFLHA